MADSGKSKQLLEFLARHPGLKLPTPLSNVSVLNEPDFLDFVFRKPQTDSTSEIHLGSKAIDKLCLLFSMVEFGPRNAGPLSEAMSPEYLHMLEYEINERGKPKDECLHDDLLRDFIKLTLTARRDYLVDHPEAMRERPSDSLVRMVHSCLMELKWKSLRRTYAPLTEDNGWLDFEIEMTDLIDILQRCNTDRWSPSVDA